MNNRLEGFEAFIKVVDSGSFSAAARLMGVSKAYVSQQVSKLEERLGARLLQRSTRKLSLTEVGERFYKQTEHILADLDEAEAEVATLQASPKGQLKINAPHLFGRLFIVPALAEMRRNYPDLTIEVDFSSRKVDLIEEGFDLSIELGQRSTSNHYAKKLCSTRFLLCASPSYVDKFGQPEQPTDLQNHQGLVFVERGLTRPWRLQSTDELVEIKPPCHWRGNDGYGLLQAALEGIGIAYLPDYYLKQHFEDGSLIEIMPSWTLLERDVSIVYQQRRHISSKVSLAIETLQEFFQKMA